MASLSKNAIRNLTILFGSTLTVLASAIISPSLPEMTLFFQDVPNAEFLVVLTLSLPALFIAIGAPLTGILLDKLGRKPVIVLSLILFGCSGPSGFVLDSLIGILMGRALLGLSVAGITSGFTALITDYFTGPRRNSFLGYQGAAMGLGGMIFLVIGGVLAEIGWRFSFLVYLAAFLVIPGVLLTVKEPMRRASSSGKDTDVKPSFPWSR